ncbi:MAG: zinc-dependent metalloprotease, partial [Bacteroidota bacterium]
FLLRDAHNVTGRMKRSKQGGYRLDKSRSSMNLDRTRNFPQNTEIDVRLTFSGEPQGAWVRSVTPSPDAVTVQQHHSFVQLPDDGYTPRPFDPRSGFMFLSYQDYGTPIDQPLVKRFIRRHRLEKKDPSAEKSEAVEPLVYYLDPGIPEPVMSALKEGAAWWNQAFEAAGYENAFQVEVLPEDADPLDVRYNVIQWVHRSTRGWSYGSSVYDPRTGEIIKGHVSLGSLRVRQDFMIAQGLVTAYEAGKEVDPRLMEMALARLRQLSAHEVGHTLGLVHNYTASAVDRSSVMDYPHPYIQLKGGEIDFSAAYDIGIGEWDKQAITYGYQDFPEGTDEAESLDNMLNAAFAGGLKFLPDQDARPFGSAHPLAHLWDNGTYPTVEMERLLTVRKAALESFGEENIAMRQPMATLEEVLVPLYLSHRYQVEAVAKVIGGLEYTYSLRGDSKPGTQIVSAGKQRKALEVLLSTLSPETLELPENLIAMIPPHPLGYRRGRESFSTRTGGTFDPIAAASSAANHTLTFLLHPDRAARLVEYHARDAAIPGLTEVLESLVDATIKANPAEGLTAEIQKEVNDLATKHMIHLGLQEATNPQVRALVMYHLQNLHEWLEERESATPEWAAHYQNLAREIDQFLDEDDYELELNIPKIPDGSPIGMFCNGMH